MLIKILTLQNFTSKTVKLKLVEKLKKIKHVIQRHKMALLLSCQYFFVFFLQNLQTLK